jgi:purine-binding chemotaxis protein CheW
MSSEQYLTFFLRGEEYGVGILRVKEIIEYETVTRVPTTPAHVRGVINLRGSVLPVIDLAAKFGHDESEASRTTCIVVLEVRQEGELLALGIVADAMSEVVDIPAAAIEPPPAFGTNVRVDFLTGMGKLERRIVLILDLDRILSPAEMQQAVHAAADAA